MAKNKKIDIKFKEQDYDISLLPTTRRRQFKDILSHEYKSILLLGMWLFIFFIPFILTESIASIYSYTYIMQNGASQTPEEIASFRLMVIIIKESTLVPAYMIFSLGIAGTLRIIRNLVYGEALFFKEDFVFGIKKYWKMCLLTSLVYGLLKGATNVLLHLITNYTNQTYLYIIGGFAIGIFYFLIIPIIYFTISLSITYQLSFGSLIINSVKFALSNIFITILFSLPLFGLYFIWFIGSLPISILILIVVVFFLGPLYIIVWHLFVTSKFDKFINEKQFPSIYKKGLQKGE